jgi:hypothetical protein
VSAGPPHDTGRDAPAARLERALHALGVRARVEARDGFALLIAADPAPLADPAIRAATIALAAEHGYRSVAVEVG